MIFQGFINKTISLNVINIVLHSIKLWNILAIDKVLVYVCLRACMRVWEMQGNCQFVCAVCMYM